MDGAESKADERGAKLGLLWMLLATVCFGGMSVFVKLLREDGMSTNEVMFWRMAPGLPWVWIELRLRRLSVWPERARTIAARSLYGLGAMACYFYALRTLSVIQYTVLTLMQPVFVALLAPAMLAERLRRSAVVALAVALLGALVVLRPDRVQSVRVELLPVVVGLAATVLSALAHIYVRRATSPNPEAEGRPVDPPERVVFWFTVAVSLVALLGGLTQGDFLRGLPPGLELSPAVLKIAGAAGFGLAGQLFMTRAYGRAAAPIVAMVAYSAIPASLVLDWLIWDLRPGIAEIAGSLAMVGAGVLLVRGRNT
ncbi:MAG: DMT family transporter [Enhygromyxa sp.]